MSETTKKWYVLRAISGKENKVKEHIESEIKNSDLGQYVSQVSVSYTHLTLPTIYSV